MTICTGQFEDGDRGVRLSACVMPALMLLMEKLPTEMLLTDF